MEKKFSPKRLWLTIAQQIELLIILFFIILNIFDLLEFLSPTFDYVDKLSGIIAIAYLIYLASPTKIILGTQQKKIDFALIMSFILLMFNKITTAATGTYELLKENAQSIIEISKTTAEAQLEFTLQVQNVQQLTSADFTLSFFQQIMETLSFSHHNVYFAVTDGINTLLLAASTPSFSVTNISNYLDGSLFYVMKFLTENQIVVEKLAFMLGGVALIILAIYCAYTIKIKPSSFLHVLHGDTKRFHRKPLRAVAIFLSFSFFFLFIFQLMVEWLGVVIDAPIAFLGILITFLLMIRFRHLFGPRHVITEIGETGEALYEEFISLFHTPYGVALGFAGILILHMITDFGIYILSYTFFQHEMLYFDQGPVFFAAHHTPLFSIVDLFVENKTSLLFQDLAVAASPLTVMATFWIYLFNVIAIFFLFFAPVYMWWVMFKKKKAHEKEWILVFSAVAIAIYMLLPLFHLGRVDVYGIVGTDMTTTSIRETKAPFPAFTAIIISIIIGGAVFVLSLKKWLRRDLIYLSFALASLFFGIYIYYYFIDIAAYYGEVIAYQFMDQNYFLLFYILVFGLMSVLFYPIAFFLFLYECKKHYLLAKNE
jgi:hypothetical protein